MRSEVRSLRLDQIDWRGHVVSVFRLKRRQPQVYPLLHSVAEAVARYIDSARPKANYPEVFLGLLAPHSPLSSGAMSALVRTDSAPWTSRHSTAGRTRCDTLVQHGSLL